MDTIDSVDHGPIGYIGEFPEKIKFEDFYNIISDKLETQPYVIPAGPNKIKRVGIVSGGADDDYQFAIDKGADTFLCGQIRESVSWAVKEAKINFINAGHYNTEKIRN